MGRFVLQDNSNEIDYNEFAKSGMIGGKFFAARSGGFSGFRTISELREHRKSEERIKGQVRGQSAAAGAAARCMHACCCVRAVCCCVRPGRHCHLTENDSSDGKITVCIPKQSQPTTA